MYVIEKSAFFVFSTWEATQETELKNKFKYCSLIKELLLLLTLFPNHEAEAYKRF
jgi:hypothetical protein